MGFSDALEEETRAVARVPVCKVELIRQEMNDTDRASFDSALLDLDNISTEVIRRAVNHGREGARNRVGRKVLSRHRNQLCPCFASEGVS